VEDILGRTLKKAGEKTGPLVLVETVQDTMEKVLMERMKDICLSGDGIYKREREEIKEKEGIFVLKTDISLNNYRVLSWGYGSQSYGDGLFNNLVAESCIYNNIIIRFIPRIMCNKGHYTIVQYSTVQYSIVYYSAVNN